MDTQDNDLGINDADRQFLADTAIEAEKPNDYFLDQLTSVAKLTGSTAAEIIADPSLIKSVEYFYPELPAILGALERVRTQQAMATQNQGNVAPATQVQSHVVPEIQVQSHVAPATQVRSHVEPEIQETIDESENDGFSVRERISPTSPTTENLRDDNGVLLRRPAPTRDRQFWTRLKQQFMQARGAAEEDVASLQREILIESVKADVIIPGLDFEDRDRIAGITSVRLRRK